MSTRSKGDNQSCFLLYHKSPSSVHSIRYNHEVTGDPFVHDHQISCPSLFHGNIVWLSHYSSKIKINSMFYVKYVDLKSQNYKLCQY